MFFLLLHVFSIDNCPAPALNSRQAVGSQTLQLQEEEANGDDDAPLDNTICRDLDNDGCDDCSSGVDDPSNDGADFDNDGICDAGDDDDDSDWSDDDWDVGGLLDAL